MIYALVLIGLVLIYIGLKFDKKSNDKKTFKSFVPGNADIEKIKDLDDTIKYLSLRMDDIESAILLLNDRISEVRTMCENNHLQGKKTDKENNLLQENREKVSNLEYKVEIDKKVEDNKNDINKSIYKLNDSGKSIEEIASELRIGKGEVSLRLGLRK